MHFGEVIEPRLLGRPSGRGAPAVRAAFDEDGLPLRPLARDERELRDWLSGLGRWVEPEAARGIPVSLDLPAALLEHFTDMLSLDAFEGLHG